MKIAAINRLDQQALTEALIACCHCRHWAERVAAKSPYDGEATLRQLAESIWQTANEAEILEAFSGHPQIGDMAALRNKYATTASAEQGQVASADEDTLIRLRDLNQAYLDKFGFIFIVCATGKSAAEMMSLLEARIGNDREAELANGAAEQAKIMQLRIDKLLEEHNDG